MIPFDYIVTITFKLDPRLDTISLQLSPQDQVSCLIMAGVVFDSVPFNIMEQIKIFVP